MTRLSAAGLFYGRDLTYVDDAASDTWPAAAPGQAKVSWSARPAGGGTVGGTGAPATQVAPVTPTPPSQGTGGGAGQSGQTQQPAPAPQGGKGGGAVAPPGDGN